MFSQTSTSIIILSSTLCLRIPDGIFLPKCFIHISLFHSFLMSHPSYPKKDKEFKLWNTLLCAFLHLLVTIPLLRAWNCFSLHVGSLEEHKGISKTNITWRWKDHSCETWIFFFLTIIVILSPLFIPFGFNNRKLDF